MKMLLVQRLKRKPDQGEDDGEGAPVRGFTTRQDGRARSIIKAQKSMISMVPN